MKTSVKILNELGLHARPISKWIAIFKGKDVKVSVEKDGKSFNGTSMISLMQMAAKKDDELVIEVLGNDDEALMNDLVALIEDGFGE